MELHLQLRLGNGGGPEPFIKLLAGLIRHERRPAKRTRLLVVVHPTVHTRPVKNVLAIRQTPDLLAALELVQADGAALRRVSFNLFEPDHGKEFPHQKHRRWRLTPGQQMCPGLRPHARVGVEEIGKTQEMKERENEAADETQKREGVEEEVGEEDLCVTWESHW